MSKKKAKPQGRPSKYSAALVQEICEHIEQGMSLRTFCTRTGAPSQSMIYRWLDKHPEFREHYARARETQADTFADMIVDIADQEEDAQRARVRIDARKWAASKMQPKKYGDKSETTLVGKDGGPIAIDDMSETDRARRVAMILGRASKPNGHAKEPEAAL